MKIIGGGKVRFFEPNDELPHKVGTHKLWQESVLLHWYDLNAGFGGMHRIGHEFNNTKQFPNGQLPLWLTLYKSGAGIYKQTEVLPLTQEDFREDGFGGGKACRFAFDGKHCHWYYQNDDVTVDLVVEDFHPAVDLWPRDIGTLSDDFAKDHLEAAGVVKGHIIIRGERHEINGYGYRDHSWGIREWESFYSHRWITGVLGRNRSFGAITWHGLNNTMRKVGYLMEGDSVIYAEDIDIVAFVEIDACTHRGGIVVMKLPGGRELTLNCTPLGMGAISFYPEIACLDTMCSIRASDSKDIGYCTFETTTNPQFGTRRPTNLIKAYIDNGFSGM